MTFYSYIRLFVFVAFVALVTKSNAQFYYGSKMEFGKNRIQHKEFLWSQYNFDKYDVFFYQGGKPLAIYAAKVLNANYEAVQDALEYTIEDRLQFIIYNKQTDFKQSNIGLVTTDADNVGGVTNIVGSKIALYYDGNTTNFERQVKAGLAEIAINQLMYGGNWREVLRSSTFLSLPNWYKKGLVSYLSYEWDTELDNKVRDGILSGRFNKLSRLLDADESFAGHSIWNYIADTYGPSVIPNILYMTKVSRNIESGFLFVLGSSLKTLTLDWEKYYLNKYENLDVKRTLPTTASFIKKPSKKKIYFQAKLSPDGKYLAYATNEMGQMKLYLSNLQTHKTKRIFKAEKKLNRLHDLTFPLITWHPTSEFFTFFTEEIGRLWMTTYTLETNKKQKRELFNFEKVIDVSYSHDGRRYVFSAVQNGQTDIFVYNVISNSVEQITKDVYDDFTPKFINNSTEIIFASNRSDDTIRFTPEKIEPNQPHTDLFLYNYKSKVPVLKRLTNTVTVSEISPVIFDKTHITFLSDFNGIKNKYIANFDSTIDYIDTTVHYKYILRSNPITNYASSILENDINGGKEVEVLLDKGAYKMYVKDQPTLADAKVVELEPTPYRSSVNSGKAMKNSVPNSSNGYYSSANSMDTTIVLPKKKTKILAPNEVDIDNYVFEFEKMTTLNPTVIDEKKSVKDSTVATSTDTVKVVAKNKVKEFQLPKQLNYNKFFNTDYLVSQLDNSFLGSSYQQFHPGTPFYNPGLNGFFKLGVSDLFENDRLTGGIRLSGDLKSNEYFASYELLEKRWDKQFVFHRQTIQAGNSTGQYKMTTNEGKYLVKYPFSEVASIRTSFTLRSDRYVYQATDDRNARRVNEFKTWGIGKIEYVFDNSIGIGLNILKGTRFKAFAEYYNQAEIIKNNSVVLGLDLRHYIKIHREFIWANRFAASTALGSQRLIYYLGGMDNWLFQKFDATTRIDYTQNYAFQTIATNMRGFSQNVRNGNNFAVINSEFRMPLFRYLYNKPLRSEFINNFQIIGFGDIGTAWSGIDPYSDQNTLFTKVIAPRGSPLEITLNSYENPIVGGYGWGLRSKLFGYFVRADWAHGIRDGSVQKRMFYLSLGLDF